MKHPHKRALIAATLAACVWPTLGMAQSFPSKTLTIVVPFPAGGGPDVAARVLAEKLAPKLGQAVVVENKPGAGALLGAGTVARATPDGHTLLLTPNTLAISPHVLAASAVGNLDVQKDLVPVVAPATTPLALVAHPTLSVKNLAELSALARTKVDMTYGSPGNGSPMHFAGEMFKKSTSLNLLHVPYRGVAPSLNAALAGEVQLLFVALGGALPHIKAGKLVPLAVVEDERSALLPQVPTATEQGVKGVEVAAWYGVFAPAGTPAAAITRLNMEINEALKLPDVRERFTGAGLEVLGGTPARLADFVKADHQRYGSLARELKIRAD
ncbi:Bug family tripartite tricarboxylate transporter substrate binding protein [Hydrogenophaga defluvii]|uniref:Bug family tripartite tricarboxylate transporter substrate binding protein n=1 Tax=Hydrogenophaga defluvii TaxID=249410 RepID=A0ABW2SAA9_9BURK